MSVGVLVGGTGPVGVRVGVLVGGTGPVGVRVGVEVLTGGEVGVAVTQAPPGSPVMVTVYDEHPALAVTSATFT